MAAVYVHVLDASTRPSLEQVNDVPQQAAMVPWRLMNTGGLLFADAKYTLQYDSAILALFLSP